MLLSVLCDAMLSSQMSCVLAHQSVTVTVTADISSVLPTR